MLLTEHFFYTMYTHHIITNLRVEGREEPPIHGEHLGRVLHWRAGQIPGEYKKKDKDFLWLLDDKEKKCIKIKNLYCRDFLYLFLPDITEVDVGVVAGEAAEVGQQRVPGLQVVVQPHQPARIEHRQAGQVFLDAWLRIITSLISRCVRYF